MGMEKMNFLWYLKKFTPLAIVGYLAGVAVFSQCADQGPVGTGLGQATHYPGHAGQWQAFNELGGLAVAKAGVQARELARLDDLGVKVDPQHAHILFLQLRRQAAAVAPQTKKK